MRKLSEEGDDHQGVKYKLRHFNKFKVLLIVTVVLLLLLIIFITLFAVEKSEDHETKGEPCAPTFCGTKACLYASLGEV